MKIRLYQIAISTLGIIFLCLWPLASKSQEADTLLINKAEQQPTKKRRLSKKERLQAKNKSSPEAAPKKKLNSPPVLTARPPAQEELKKDTSLVGLPQDLATAPSELAETFKNQEDTESHLLRDVSSLIPKEAYDTEEVISVNLDNTPLPNLLAYMEGLIKVKFLSGDAINPPPQAAGKITGNLISYKTHKPMSKKSVWELFLNFLDLFGLTLVATHYTDNYPDSYTAMPLDAANQAPLPAFVGVDWKSLPDNDIKIRYVYFVENGPAANLSNIVQDFKSKTAIVQAFAPLNAIIFSDKSSNIRSLMAIISELDSVSMPESMSVLRLKHANAEDVVALYDSLISTEEKGAPLATRLFGAKKQSTAVYFPEDTRIFAEQRTNALIILGNKEGITKVENFIIDYVDTALKQPYSPLYVYKLEYANSDDIAAILSKVTNFAPGTPAATFGGVRDGDKYFRPMTFISEPSGNKVLIKAEKEDYLKVKDIIKKLDVKQPQIAIEVLIVNVSVDKIKSLGAQLRNKSLDTLGITNNVAFQTSGLNLTPSTQSPIVVDANGGLMGNLVSLATSFSPGTTLISIGNNLVGGVWALFQALETYTYANVVSHPFLTTTNKYTAQVSVGETRRVATGTVTGAGPTANTLGDVAANTTVAITPQINSDGIINLAIEISINTFTDPDATSATRDTKVVKTSANLANNEILAIGGIIQETLSEFQTGVPVLQRIPLIGWIFKNKTKTKVKDNLLIFISPQIVQPRMQGGVGDYTKRKARVSRDDMCSIHDVAEQRDPLHRWFFKDQPCENVDTVDDFLANKNFCAIPKGHDCRTGQECEADSLCGESTQNCPPVTCPYNYEACKKGCTCKPDHATPLCKPQNPRPGAPTCAEDYKALNEASQAPLSQPRKNIVAADSENKQPPASSRTSLKRKQSVTDFLPSIDKNEVAV